MLTSIRNWSLASLFERNTNTYKHSPQTRTKPFRSPLILFIAYYFSFIDTARCQLGHSTETANCRWWLFLMFQAEPEAKSVKKKPQQIQQKSRSSSELFTSDLMYLISLANNPSCFYRCSILLLEILEHSAVHLFLTTISNSYL